MTWQAVLGDVLGAFESGSVSFTCGDYLVKLSTTAGAPARFTLGAAIAAAERIFFDQTGQLQVGDVLVVVTEGATPASSTATSTALAAAIAAAVTPSRPVAAPAAIATPAAGHATA